MLILSFLILKVSSKSFFPFSLYSAKEKNSARKTSVVHAQFTKSLYRLQRKNMRKNKLSIVQLCLTENGALHCSILKYR